MQEEKNENNQTRVAKAQQFDNSIPVLFDSYPEPVFIVSRDGTILEANGAFASKFGKFPEECLGANIYVLLSCDLLMPELAAQCRKITEEVLRTGKPLSFDDLQDGQAYRSTLYPLRSSEGDITRLLIMAQNVTSHKRIVPDVENKQRFIQTLIDASPGVFCMVDKNWRFTAWNACMRDEILCKSDGEIAGSDVISIIYPGDRPLIQQQIRNVMTEGVEEHAEVRVLCGGGSTIRWFVLKAKRLLIDENFFLIATGIDIDERKQVEYALQLSEKKFRTITEQLDGEVFICNQEGIFTYVSPGSTKISGFKPEEMIGHRFTEFLSEKEIPEAIKSFSEILSNTSQKKVIEHCMKRKDGSTYWGELHVQQYENEENSGTIGFCVDVTRRKRYESFTEFRLRILKMAESHSTEELLRATLDEAEQLTGSPIGFCHFIEDDPVFPSLRVVASNIQKTMHGMNSSDMAHPSLADSGLWASVMKHKQALITNNYSSEDHGIRFADGHPQITRTLVVPMIQAGKVMAVLGVGNKPVDYNDDDLTLLRTLTSIACDIVSRKHAEMQANEMQEILAQSQKMDLVGQLACGIAHDFNNMLGVILGNIEMALDQTETLEEPLQYNLKNILAATNRSANLTRQLLSFARKETIMPIVLELNALVEKMLTVLRQMIGHNITIIWKPDTAPALVKADPAQLDQILINLCLNARDAFDNGGGIITIEVGKFCDHKILKTPHYPCTVPGDYVTISITDNGKGIEKKHFPHIFEPFFTTKKKGNGYGMGLSTVYGIVKQNSGCLECRSEEGEGTTFKIHLPRYREEVFADPGESQQSSTADKYGKETILLVEDEQDILELCKIELENKEYRVLGAPSPHEAIRLAGEYEGVITLLLTDVIMPGMNGCDLFNKLQQLNPSLKVLFMSGYSSDVVARNNLLEEGINFIQKPFSLKSLSKMVQHIVNQS